MPIVSPLEPASAKTPVEAGLIRLLLSQPMTVGYAPPTFTAPGLLMRILLLLETAEREAIGQIAGIDRGRATETVAPQKREKPRPGHGQSAAAADVSAGVMLMAAGVLKVKAPAAVLLTTTLPGSEPGLVKPSPIWRLLLAAMLVPPV